MKSRRKSRKARIGTAAGIILFLSTASVMAAAGEKRPVYADDRESVLKSAEVESKGRIKGMDGFYYDGEDIRNLADSMELLYHLCQ